MGNLSRNPDVLNAPLPPMACTTTFAPGAGAGVPQHDHKAETLDRAVHAVQDFAKREQQGRPGIHPRR